MPSAASPRATKVNAARTLSAIANFGSAAVQAPSFSSAALAYFPTGTALTSPVTVLSSAEAGEWADPQRMTKPKKNPARRYLSKRYIVALHACSRREARAQIRRWWYRIATGGSAVPLDPLWLTAGRGYRRQNN